MIYKYTEKEIEEIIKSIIIIVDTREQDNEHILKSLENKKITTKKIKLDYGDYSFLLPKNEKLNIDRDIYFNKKIVIERKNSLEELSGNLTKGRTQLENELLRKKNAIFTIMLEKGSISDIIESKYETDYKCKSYLATILTFKNRYNIDIVFMKREYSWIFIYYNFYYYLRNYLK